MRLDSMLEGCSVSAVPPLDVCGLQYDSRRVRPGEAFFAFPGERVDGHSFVGPAVRGGAVAVVSERSAPDGLQGRWARVAHGRRALAAASLRFFRRPDRAVRVTAVTGTNGKTTTAHIIDLLLRASGKPTALLGTIEHRVGERSVPAVNTTPEALDIVRSLAELRDIGGTHCTMEASSHALALERVSGIEFHTAVFTNLTPDHLEFHGDMQSYMAAKMRLFEGAGARPPLNAVANADDEAGRRILGLGLSNTISYGRRGQGDVRAERVRSDAGGVRFEVASPAGRLRVACPMPGAWNVENLLAAIAAGLCHGLSVSQIEDRLRLARPVPGRFEVVDCGQPFLVAVDYAHTEDALRRLVRSARAIAETGRTPGRVLLAFGCGGDRDPSKRAPMGRVARLADFSVITSDNPRSEDPLAIIRDIADGLRGASRWACEPDRLAAIRLALEEARPGDVVLIAGKGHETTQTGPQGTTRFDDRSAAREALGQMGYCSP